MIGAAGGGVRPLPRQTYGLSERGLMLQNERIAELPSPLNLVRLPNRLRSAACVFARRLQTLVLF